MQHMTIVTPIRPRRSRIAGRRSRNAFRVVRRELGVATTYVKSATGVVTLAYVHDAQVDAREACSRRMTIAAAAHDALHAEHSRQAREASAKLEAIDTEAAQVGPNIATDIAELLRVIARRGAISDRNAALRELRKLDANPPATPLRPRPRATSWICSAGA